MDIQERLLFWHNDSATLKNEFEMIDLDDGLNVNYCKFRDILYPVMGLCK